MSQGSSPAIGTALGALGSAAGGISSAAGGAALSSPSAVGFTGQTETGAGYTGATLPSSAPPTPQGTSGDPTSNLKSNLGLMQKFTNLLGKTPEEREKNSKVFAALVKDLGNVGKSLTDSTLMQRMMKEQMGGMEVMGGGGPGGMPAGIPRSDFSSPIMPQGGFR